MKNFLTLVFCLSGFFFLSAQTLPEVDIPITSRNYHEICAQLDDYFAHDFDLEEAEEECADNAWVKYQRWKWWWRDRVNADGSFPDLRAQWLASQKISAKALNRNGSPTWKHEGPVKNPNGGYWGMGRTKNVAFHPSDTLTFFVGTPDGGIWKTSDGGQNWIPMGDGLPYLPVSIILIHPQHPDTMYISLGDKGGWWNWNMGVYKSTDGGFTWAPTGLDWDLAQNNVIYNLIMSQENPNVMFAATNRGIMRTTDGGDSWQTLKNGEITDIEFQPGNDSTIYAGLHDYWGFDQVLKSTDGGDTWVQVSNFQVTNNDIRLAVCPAAPQWLGVHFANHKFVLSQDGGNTYTEYDAPEDDGYIFSFSATDSNTVYIAGVSVSRSRDHGATWEKITHWYNDGVHAEVHADAHDFVFNPHNPNELWYCNDGGVYRYDEPTETWTDLSNGLGIAQFYRIALSETGQVKIMAGSQDNGGWLRTGFGWRHTNGGDAMCQAVDPTNNNIVYTEYYGGNDIYRSTNGFLSSENIADSIPGSPSGDWVTPFMLNTRNPKTFLVGFEDIFRSFDRGSHFHKISDNLTGAVDRELRDIAMSMTDTNFIVATNANRVYQTTNSGQTWTSKLVAGTDDITRITIHPSNNKRMWVTKGGYSDGKKVYTTTNGWISSTNISGNLPNVPVNCILFDSTTNYLLIGTDIGVFYSDADSIDWQPYGEGLPAVYVLDLKIRYATRTLYAGTHGRGVWSVGLEQVVDATEPVASSAETHVFPNPSSGVLLFKSLGHEPFDGEIALYDATGRKVWSKQSRDQALEDQVVDVSGFPAGAYWLKATGKNSQSVVREKVLIYR